MTETIPPPHPEPVPTSQAVDDPVVALEPKPARQGRGALPVLCAIGFLILAVGLGLLWREERHLAERDNGFDPGAFAGLQSQVRGLAQRLATLEQRPAPAPPPPAPPPVPPVALRAPPPPVDLGPIEARIAALEKRPEVPATDPAIAARMDDMQKRLALTQADAARNTALGERAATVRAAQTALDAGQPLGDIPGGPPALSRFGRATPPTEAALRLAFPEAADRAVAASRPSTEGETVGQRMWQNARSLVTIRQGDKVLLGAPAAETLGGARARLDAGDLGGAVAALAGLDGPAAEAMAEWRDQARALVDARAALAGLARG